MKKLIKLATIGVIGSILLTACSSGEENTLYVGTNAEYPPFEFIADNDDGVIDQYDGIDMLIIKEIADELGYDVVVEDTPFDSLILSLNAGKTDCIISAMTITEEREENVDFSVPYLSSEQYILVSSDNTDINSAEDLAGKSIGVQTGTTGDFIATDDVPDSDVKRYNRAIDAFLDMKNGKLDAVLIDSGIAKLYANEYPDDTRLVTETSMFDVEEYGIAVNEDNPELLAEINTVLEDMISSGRIDEIYVEYSAE